MEEPDFEEGEACYYKDEANLDPDIALSYIVRVPLFCSQLLYQYISNDDDNNQIKQQFCYQEKNLY